MSRSHRGALLVAALVVSTRPFAGAADEAPQAGRGRVLEEIVVTAQKTEENVVDVPISMSVLSDDFLADHQIGDFQGLDAYVPNARLTSGGPGANDVRLRGFGSTWVNKAFEQPAGLVTDGIPYNRLPYFFSALFDVERIEVLRGPQGTLVGKNTTAGAFNVTTKSPTDEVTADLALEVGERGHSRFDAAVGGPLVAGFANFRLAAVVEDRDGYLDNTTAAVQRDTAENGPDRSRNGFRAKLDFPDLLGTFVRLSYERVESDSRGQTAEVRSSTPLWVAFQRQFDPNFDIVPYNEVTSSHATPLYLVDIDTAVLDARRELFGGELALLAGHSVMKFRGRDIFPTAAPSFFLDDHDRNPQTTVELRAHSPELPGFFGLASLFGFDLGRSDVLAGFFFQRRAIDGAERGVFNAALYGLEAATSGPGGIRPGGLPIPLPPLLVTPPPPGFEEDFVMDFEQDSESIAGFTHLSWSIARATLEVGMRYTVETKEADWDVFVDRPGPVVIAVTGGGFTEHKTLDESAFTPKVSLLYDWSDAITTYAYWAKGFKGGGFNEFAFAPTATTTVTAEETNVYEGGAKTRLLDGRMALNLALFRQDVDNLQVFQTVTLPPSAKSVNAGEARSQGAEIDLSWLVTDWFDLYGAFGYDDAKYLEYPLGSCESDHADSDGNGDGGCDLSGRQLEKAPRWTATVVPGVDVPLTVLPGDLPGWARALSLIGSFTAEYQDVHKLSFELSGRTRQESFFRFAATLGVRGAQGWSAGVTADNFTSAEVSTFNAEIFGPGNYRQYPIEPRFVFGWARYSF